MPDPIESVNLSRMEQDEVPHLEGCAAGEREDAPCYCDEIRRYGETDAREQYADDMRKRSLGE